MHEDMLLSPLCTLGVHAVLLCQVVNLLRLDACSAPNFLHGGH